CSNKYQVCLTQSSTNLSSTLCGSSHAYRSIPSRTKSLGIMLSQADARGSRGKIQHLRIGVHSDKTYSTNQCVNHAIDSIHPATTYTSHNNIYMLPCLLKFIQCCMGRNGIIFGVSLSPA